MSASFFFLVFLSIPLLSYAEAISPPANCGPEPEVVDIRPPFRLKPQQRGDPSFELFCRNNSTMLHFPLYGDLVVKSISYDQSKLDLLDPKNCVHEVFLNLDLSLTPFRYLYVVKNYTYFNCSTPIGTWNPQVPCLSGSRHHVYTVESYAEVPDSCSPIKTVAIPFAYSSYLSDANFGLRLTWDFPQPDHFGFQFKVTWSSSAPKRVPMIVGVVLLAAAALVVKMKILYIPKLVSNEDKKKQSTEELLPPQA
ncbi:hypothetical protein V6N13_074579 [Hibiscus sabdariffa]|uniref:RING-type E3 ubiquitin transferase n=1 Tax=Hibiscus sabdariffa TaxID=183260 RepID=A0ABR2U901_9ROSI